MGLYHIVGEIQDDIWSEKCLRLYATIRKLVQCQDKSFYKFIFGVGLVEWGSGSAWVFPLQNLDCFGNKTSEGPNIIWSFAFSYNNI